MTHDAAVSYAVHVLMISHFFHSFNPVLPVDMRNHAESITDMRYHIP